MEPNPTPFALLLQLQRNPRPFTRAEVQQLPRDRQGVYAIWEPPEYGESSDTCTYVGMSTTCIRRRLLDHINDETNPELRYHLQDFRDHLTFTVVFTTGDTQTRALERHAINTWQPPTNRRYPITFLIPPTPPTPPRSPPPPHHKDRPTPAR